MGMIASLFPLLEIEAVHSMPGESVVVLLIRVNRRYRLDRKLVIPTVHSDVTEIAAGVCTMTFVEIL
jgi:hypothetical protein